MRAIDYDKTGGLVPAIIQDADTGTVLMLGYMNREALEKTQESGRVTFYSRSKQRLWTKGESSGNYLEFVEYHVDCDGDALLVKARPQGPVCHTGTDTCWSQPNHSGHAFLAQLEAVIAQRKASLGTESKSYVASLFEKGVPKIAQKVGEEAVETVIEAMDNNPDLFLGESADLVFHLLVLLQAKGFTLKDVLGVLEARHRESR